MRLVGGWWRGRGPARECKADRRFEVAAMGFSRLLAFNALEVKWLR